MEKIKKFKEFVAQSSKEKQRKTAEKDNDDKAINDTLVQKRDLPPIFTTGEQK